MTRSARRWEAHAGWRGTAAGIAARTVEAMTREFGSDPADIRAAIGPLHQPVLL